jgi:hypothetical protein
MASCSVSSIKGADITVLQRNALQKVGQVSETRFFSVCLATLTTNKFYGIRKDQENRDEFCKNFFAGIYKITHIATNDPTALGSVFNDYLEDSELKGKPQFTDCSKCGFPRTGKFASMRIGGGTGQRLVGFLCKSVFCVCYIDYDHSLYNHGS